MKHQVKGAFAAQNTSSLELSLSTLTRKREVEERGRERGDKGEWDVWDGEGEMDGRVGWKAWPYHGATLPFYSFCTLFVERLVSYFYSSSFAWSQEKFWISKRLGLRENLAWTLPLILDSSKISSCMQKDQSSRNFKWRERERERTLFVPKCGTSKGWVGPLWMCIRALELLSCFLFYLSLLIFIS